MTKMRNHIVTGMRLKINQEAECRVMRIEMGDSWRSKSSRPLCLPRSGYANRAITPMTCWI